MAWKAPGPPMLRAGVEKPKTPRPHKLPTMARGGGLRVGRIVSDARGNNNARQSPSLVVQEEERRIQDELIEILTVKLANKEKEIEMLKVKQSDVNRELGGYDHQMQQQQEEHARMMTEVATTNHELQRQVQVLQIQCEQLQVESETHCTAAIEQRRLREKDQTQARLEIKESENMVNELQRKLQQAFSDRNVLESKLQQTLQNQQAQNNVISRLETKCDQLEQEVLTSHEICQEIRDALTTEIQQRQEVEVVVKQLEEEKCALEAKQRALVKALKGANMRAVDVEKKWSKRSRVEDQLTLQLEESRKENVDLKARKGQMSSQAKYLQARIANLENAYATQERKLEDATVELENARKYCRDCQFRTKQLQEENVFLKNRKIATEVPSTASEQLDKSFLAPGSPTESQSVKAEHERDDEVPCWMKE